MMELFSAYLSEVAIGCDDSKLTGPGIQGLVK
jgi:hypothetical protein